MPRGTGVHDHAVHPEAIGVVERDALADPVDLLAGVDGDRREVEGALALEGRRSRAARKRQQEKQPTHRAERLSRVCFATVDLAQLLHDDYRRYATRACAGVKRGGRFVPIPYAEVERMVAGATLQLLERGIGHGDRVAVVSRTRLEWLTADQAIASAGAVVVPVYPTLTAPAMKHLIEDSGAKLAIVEG